MKPRIVVVGAPLDTGNLGVSALGQSVLAGIFTRVPDADVTLFDYGRGVRRKCLRIDGADFWYSAVGCVLSRRFYRPENLWNMWISSMLGTRGNSGVRKLREAICVFDITGGDSFSDLYGPTRFRAAAMRKQLVLRLGVPLVLLPQSFGPFGTPGVQAAARRIIERAEAVWTRDEHSRNVIQRLFRGHSESPKCRLGVDVAFLLQPQRPCLAKAELVDEMIGGSSEARIGINISGLLLGNQQARRQFGLCADYRHAIVTFIRWLLKSSGSSVYLVSHVLGNRESSTSDMRACEDVYGEVVDGFERRVTVVNLGFNANEIKWFISQMDWFCGARMHSTIAALSSFVPAVVLAYSDKARGVFDTCGQGGCVVDMRSLTTEEVVAKLIESWKTRELTHQSLLQSVPKVLETAESQMDEIVFSVLAGVHR